MTSRAYPENYLSEVQLALGAAFDFAINTCRIPGQNFLQLFAESSVSKQIENGDPSYFSEKNGIEIAADIILETSGKPINKPLEIVALHHFGHSQEYWIGWAACYFQWFSAKRASLSLRLLQMYALRNKNLDRASLEALYRLSKLLDCSIEDLTLIFREISVFRKIPILPSKILICKNKRESVNS